VEIHGSAASDYFHFAGYRPLDHIFGLSVNPGARILKTWTT